MNPFTMASKTDLRIAAHRDRGEHVVRFAGRSFLRHHGVMLPLEAIPSLTPLPDYDAARRFLRENRSWLLWYFQPAAGRRNWWHVVCREHDVSVLSKNVRRDIRRGQRLNAIGNLRNEPVAIERLHRCHRMAASRYSGFQPERLGNFVRYFERSLEHPVIQAWYTASDDAVNGYIVCLEDDTGVFIDRLDVAPDGLAKCASFVLLNHVLDHYVRERGIPVSNGTRSINHKTNMQEFLRRLGFQREYSRLCLLYRPPLRQIVRGLYPFYGFLEGFRGLPLLRQLVVLLRQEALARGNDLHPDR